MFSLSKYLNGHSMESTTNKIHNEIENEWLAYDEQTDTLHHTSDTNNDEDVSEAIKVTVDDTEYIVDLQLQA